MGAVDMGMDVAVDVGAHVDGDGWRRMETPVRAQVDVAFSAGPRRR